MKFILSFLKFFIISFKWSSILIYFLNIGNRVSLKINYVNNFNVLLISQMTKLSRITCKTYIESHSASTTCKI